MIPSKKYQKVKKVLKNPLHLRGVSYIICNVVTLIAMKREVAAEKQVFRGANVKLGNWRQVTVYKLRIVH